MFEIKNDYSDIHLEFTLMETSHIIWCTFKDIPLDLALPELLENSFISEEIATGVSKMLIVLNGDSYTDTTGYEIKFRVEHTTHLPSKIKGKLSDIQERIDLTLTTFYNFAEFMEPKAHNGEPSTRGHSPIVSTFTMPGGILKK